MLESHFGGLEFWEILGLAVLLIWAVNRFFRKRNEADEERAALFSEELDKGHPPDQGLTHKYLSDELLDDLSWISSPGRFPKIQKFD